MAEERKKEGSRGVGAEVVGKKSKIVLEELRFLSTKTEQTECKVEKKFK